LNIKTRKFEKLKKYLRGYKNCGYTAASLIGLGICVFSIVVYRVLTLILRFEEDEDGAPVRKKATMEQTIIGLLYSCAYTTAVIVFGTIYKKLSHAHTYAENHRYWSHFESALIFRLFWVNFFNFYLPFFLMGFEGTEYGAFDEMWQLLFTTLALK